MQENPPGDRRLAAGRTFVVQELVVLKRKAELAPEWTSDHVHPLILICDRERRHRPLRYSFSRRKGGMIPPDGGNRDGLTVPAPGDYHQDV